MKKTLTWMGLAVLIGGCAGGDGDGDDGNADDTSGSVGGESSSDGTVSGMSTTMTTAPTTAETLSTTTDPSATGDTGDTGDTGEDSTGSSELSCVEYCSVYSTSCVDHTEYANGQDCLDNCAQWPIGSADDTGGDSLGCRLYHATVAGSTDPDMHCPHAGPSGAATCVDEAAPTCDLYCTRYFGNCHDDLNAYVDMAECMDDCSAWYPGSEADTDGHTIGCHSYHANAAAADAETHCPHAGPGGGGICVL